MLGMRMPRPGQAAIHIGEVVRNVGEFENMLLQKQFDQSNVAEAGGAVERRHAAEVLHIDIGVGADEQPRILVSAFYNCLVQSWFLARCRIILSIFFQRLAKPLVFCLERCIAEFEAFSLFSHRPRPAFFAPVFCDLFSYSAA